MPFSVSNATYTITWFDESDNYVTTTDISDDVVDLFHTDTGSGEVNEARVVLKAPNGDYITSTSPVSVDKFDRIRIQGTDNASFTYDRYFEIDNLNPSQSKEEGTLLTLECLGIEYHLQNINFALPFWFSTPFSPAKRVGQSYNENRGTRQPVLSEHDTIGYDNDTRKGNGLPTFLNQHFEYNISPTLGYTILNDLKDRQGAPAADGGVLDFFEVGFDTTGVNAIDIRIFSSGVDPEGQTGSPAPETIEKTYANNLEVNPSEGDGIIANPTATRVMVLGDSKSGSLPTGRAKYNSGVFQFVYRPQWIGTISYATDARILYQGQHYKSLVDDNLNNTPPGPTSGSKDVDANWEQIDMSDEFGDSQQYSEWTDDKVELIINAGALPTSATVLSGVYTSTGALFFDSNVIIDDNGFFRTMVDDMAIGDGSTVTQQLDSYYLYPNSIWPRGFRFLCNDWGPFNTGAKDRFGIEFQNSVVERVATPTVLGGTEWVVKYKLNTGNDKLQIVLLDEGKVFEWNQPATLTNITTSDLGSECLHKWDTIQAVNGFDPRPFETDSATFPDITADGSTFAKNLKSAIEVVYDFNSALVDRVTDRVKYQSHGAWFNFRFPYPVRDAVSPYTYSENVGDIYGGGTESSATGRNEPATLDLSNLGWTPTGKLGFNQTDSDALMPLTEFGFAVGLKIEVRDPLLGTLSTLDGTASIRVAMGDTNDNVWVFDFDIPETNGNMHSISTPLSSYEVYRSHKPRYARLNNLPDLINPKDIDRQNILEERNIRWITIQHQDQYDEFGRFAPEGNLNDLSNTSLTAAFGGKITLTLDDFHFKKALFVTTGTDATRNIEAELVQRQDIQLYDQAIALANARVQIEKFQHKEFDIAVTGDKIFNIRFGDSFFFKNTSLVSDADDGANTIKLVAKRIEYSITRPVAGSGGMQRRIKGIKRFT